MTKEVSHCLYVSFWVLPYNCLNHYKELMESYILVQYFQGIVIRIYVIISVKVEVEIIRQ